MRYGGYCRYYGYGRGYSYGGYRGKREADSALLYGGLGYGPYIATVNEGPVSGPLTPFIGDAVATERGLRPLSLEGFSEDLNQDGFVDPIVPADIDGQTYTEAATAIGAAPPLANYGAYPYAATYAALYD